AAMAELRVERELRRNLDQLHRTGARIEYRACDVRDPVAFSALIEDVYSRFGRITGVIHGAGVIEDRLLADKDAESFRRVFDTKVTGALVLAANLKPETTQFFVLFSSISGRFGNRGQADYAAANEVLNKLARELDGRWPGRVVSINWGPWLSTGMVTEEARRQLAGKGVGLIPVERGCEMLVEELSYGSRAEPEVVVASLASAPGLETGRPTRTGAGSLPLLSRKVSINRAGPEVAVVREFDLHQDLYLGDHVIDGRSVVPFALATELMAEAAAAGWPGLVVTELTDIRVLRGIVMEGGPIDVLTTVRPVEGSGEPGIFLQAEVTLAGDPRVHYRCRMHMLPAGRSIAPTNGKFGNLAEAVPPALSMDELYKQWLFHGELFEAIDSIERMGPLGATGWLAPSSPGDCLRYSGEGIWLVDPVLVDAAFQMQVVWARQHWGITILPSSVGRIRVSPALAPILSHRLPVRCELRIRPETHEPVSHTDFALYGADGTVLMLIEDLEGTGNAQFNRFAGTGRRRS
ncbi:MAG TPA: SDR family NAD(P)-dependent oxidoreductase, partial [Actinomycetota bacterium]|nr:SDR family NAD(P)-dependent oxidoreductase [Actinomycetota bacterium]